MFFIASKRAMKVKWLVKWLALAFLVLPAVVSYAQIGEKIESMLKVKEMTYGDTALFVLAAVEQAEIGTDTPEAAFERARQQGWLPAHTAAGDNARIDGVALLLMKAFKLKGGLFYTLFPNAHYAYRELVYRTVIQRQADPMMRVSGDQLLYMLNRTIRFNEERSK